MRLRRAAPTVLVAIITGCSTGSADGPIAEVTVTTPLGCNQATIQFMETAPGRVIAEDGDVSRTPADMRASGGFAYRVEEIRLADEVTVVGSCFAFAAEEQTIDRFWRMTLVSPLTDRIGGLMEVVWIGDEAFVSQPDDSLDLSRVFFLDDSLLVEGSRVGVTWGFTGPPEGGSSLVLSR